MTMSSILILVLFSLCCLQACGGRFLSVDTQHNIGDGSLRSRSLHHSSEGVDEVTESVRTSTLLAPEAAAPSFTADEPRGSVRSVLVNKRAAAGEGAMKAAKHGGAVATSAEDLEASEEGGDGSARGAPGLVRTESNMGTVSWVQVPRDPHRGHPGFSIDYAGPRTHPGSHN